MASDGAEMRRHLQSLLTNPGQARDLAAHGLRTIQQRHTCAHRVDELLEIYEEMTVSGRPGGSPRHRKAL